MSSLNPTQAAADATEAAVASSPSFPQPCAYSVFGHLRSYDEPMVAAVSITVTTKPVETAQQPAALS